MLSSLVLRSALFSLFVAIAAASGFGQSADLTSDLSTRFVRFDTAKVAAEHPTGGKITLGLVSDGEKISITLEPNDLRSSRYRAVDTGSAGDTDLAPIAVNTFKGTINGEPGSVVRLNLRNSTFEGIFTSRGERFFVEPASNYSRNAAAGEHVIYRMEDAINAESFGCTSKLNEKLVYGRGLAATAIPQAVQSRQLLEIATEADAEYVTTFGSPSLANAEILGIMNVIEGIYAEQLQLDIRIVFQHTWSTGDPYAGGSTEAIARNFGAYWNTNYPLETTPRDIAHIFTGKQVAQSSGWAFIGVVCRDHVNAYGASGYISWAPAKYLITTHEIGHNLGANHVEEADGCGNSLMNATLTGGTPLVFCSLSRTQIGNYLGANNACITPNSSCRFDFDGDAKADVSIFRPSNGAWYLARSRDGFIGFQFGQTGDKTVAADYDGDGMTDAAVYRDGVWFRLKSSTNTFDGVSFGNATDTPAPADFDGDGKADVAVFRPSTGVWYQLLSANGAFSVYPFGQQGDVPIPADYDADGKADINLYRPSNGAWYRVFSATNSFYAVQFGTTGDKPVTGDFDGDGKADTAVWRPSTGTWYILRLDNTFYGTGFGSVGDIPVPADYDGDGKTDVAIFRPRDGTWYRLDSSTGGFVAYSFGLSTDQPAPAFYIP